VAPIYLVVLLPEDSARTGIPARVPIPEVTDEGPHLGYAFQWFIFATIAFVGAGIALRAGRPPAR
jgi:cytochrome oxidase assembly protein ShyY1